MFEHAPTTLLEAAATGNLAQVQALLAAEGMNINSVDAEGQTALFKAVDHGHLAVVRALLEKGADPNIVDEETYTALFYAVGAVDYATVQTMRMDDIGDDQIEGISTAWDETDAAETLNDRDYTMDENDANYYIPALHDATKPTPSEHLEMVQLLLEHGANPHIVDDNGRTALFEAVNNGYLGVVKALLERGVDPNINDGGWTALHMAVYVRQIEALRILLEHGADPLDSADELFQNYSVFTQRNNFDHDAITAKRVIAEKFKGNQLAHKAINENTDFEDYYQAWTRAAIHMGLFKADTNETFKLESFNKHSNAIYDAAFTVAGRNKTGQALTFLKAHKHKQPGAAFLRTPLAADVLTKIAADLKYPKDCQNAGILHQQARNSMRPPETATSAEPTHRTRPQS